MKKVALLVGSTGCLGGVFTQKYKNKYDIAGVARSAEKNSCGYFFIEADISKNVDYIVGEALSKFGRIDLLINNAVCYEWSDVKDLTRRSLRKQFNINVISPLLIASSVFNQFWSKTKDNLNFNRNIVNVSSISAINVYPKGQASYASCKAAMNTMTLHLANEFAEYGIRANAICPNGFPRTISTEKVADSVVDMDESLLNGKIKVIDEEDYFV